MKPPRSAVRLHWILGSLAVLHAVVLSWWNLLVYDLAKIPLATGSLWVGVATLWLLWPVVLALHSERSFVRFFVPLGVAVPFLLFRVPFGGAAPVQEYLVMAPVYVFGLPPGVYLSPWSIRDYINATRTGRADARKDLHSGQLAIETHSLPMKGEREYAEILRQRYQIELRRIAGDTDVTEKVLGHAKGYNEISEAEIKRRFGDEALKAAEEEATKHYDEAYPK